MIVPAVAYFTPFLFVPLMACAWLYGGLFILFVPIFGYGLISILDFVLGETRTFSGSEEKKLKNLRNYKFILWVWPPVQMVLIFGSLISIFQFGSWSISEQVGLMIAQGIITGAVGIVFAHELMHHKGAISKTLSDLLLGMALYGHFRTEHVKIHHRYVGTHRDAVTARFNEGFYTFFMRVIPSCLVSAWQVERERLIARNKSVFDLSNPFWIYLLIPLIYISIAFWIGGFWGITLFSIQAAVAVLHLEVVNYIEHYGLKRLINEDGKYEATQPHHSWNANHKASNLLLINLQKHSDHHVKPYKPYPLLEPFDETQAPQLPYGYPIMVIISLFPHIWRNVMNPRVLAWRKKFYPNVSSWSTTLE